MGQNRRPSARGPHRIAAPAIHLGLLASLAFAVALTAPAVAAAGAGEPASSAEFTVPASNGYTLDVKSEDGRLSVLAFREQAPVAHITDAGRFLPAGEGDYAAATYFAPAAGGPEAIEAGLGGLGEVDVSFQPSGRTRVTHLSHKGKTSGCVFPHRIVRRLGIFAGRVSFHGENGYTSVDITAAPGSVGTSPFRNCSTRSPTARREGIFGQAGPDVFLDAANPSADVSFSASTVGPGSGFFAGLVEVPPGGITVIRTAQARAARALTFDPARRAATFRPPPPFSGEATFRRGAAHPWSGSLAVDLPGVTVPLTGRSFKARLRLSE